MASGAIDFIPDSTRGELFKTTVQATKARNIWD